MYASSLSVSMWWHKAGMSAESSQNTSVLYEKVLKSVEILAVVVLRLYKNLELVHFSHEVATRLRRSQYAL